MSAFSLKDSLENSCQSTSNFHLTILNQAEFFLEICKTKKSKTYTFSIFYVVKKVSQNPLNLEKERNDLPLYFILLTYMYICILTSYTIQSFLSVIFNVVHNDVDIYVFSSCFPELYTFTFKS